MRDEHSHFPALSRGANLQAGDDAVGLPQSLRLFPWGTRTTDDRSWRYGLAGLALAGALTTAGFWIEPAIKEINLAVLYVLAVVFAALQWGRWAAVLNAVAGAFLFDYFFVAPHIWNLILPFGLLTVGLVVSKLTSAAREEAQAVRKREVLYSLTKSLATEVDLDQMLSAIEGHVLKTFQRPIIMWLPGEAGLTTRLRSRDIGLDEVDQRAAEWAFENGREAGCGTDEFSASRLHYMPLKSWRGVVGVLGIQGERSKKWLPVQERHLLETFANQAALAITRAVLVRETQRLEVLQETDKLQKALLNSISHNLRTPLASVTGALNSVLEDGALLDASTQNELLMAAREEAIRLNRLLQNLLDMTRLEGGTVKVKLEPHDVQDAVGAALEQLGDTARRHPIVINIPPKLPLVPMDFALIVQALVNLLDNALKYSPVDGPIEVGARLDDDQLLIQVADSGSGIPEQHLERVFEKFFRVAAPEGPRGTGLGLSICKGFIEAHHGRIWAQRRTGGGTEVTFSLPLGAKR
jgi:two-component system, OmpR family, sensor histidine kinase KdpD